MPLVQFAAAIPMNIFSPMISWYLFCGHSHYHNRQSLVRWKIIKFEKGVCDVQVLSDALDFFGWSYIFGWTKFWQGADPTYFWGAYFDTFPVVPRHLVFAQSQRGVPVRAKQKL